MTLEWHHCVKCGGRMYSERSINVGVCLACEDFDYESLSAEVDDIDVELGEER